MIRVLTGVIMVLAVSLLSTTAANALDGCGSCGKCESCFRLKLRRPCLKCRKPRMQCVCTPVQMVTKPVYETCYRKEQCVTQKQFVETHYRDELYTVSCPVTKYDCITVDEGCYQQIWVPKLVTKQIPRTEYVHKTACRQVPYQVTKCVPEVSTKMVPYQRVRYVQCPSTCVAGVTLGTSCGPSLHGPSCGVPGTPSCGVPGGSSYGPQPYGVPSPSAPMGGSENGPAPASPEESVPMPKEPVPRAESNENSGSYFPNGPAMMSPEAMNRQPAELGNQISPVGDPQFLDLSKGSNVRPVPEPYSPRSGSAPRFRASGASALRGPGSPNYSGNAN